MRTHHHNRKKEELRDQIRNSEINSQILAGLEPNWRYNLPREWKLREELRRVLLAGPSRV